MYLLTLKSLVHKSLEGTSLNLHWQIVFVLSDLGGGWAPTILETEEEFNYLREAMTAFVSTYKQNVLIGGSTCVEPRFDPIEYSDYTPENVDDGKCG